MPGFQGKKPGVDENLIEHYAEEMGRGAQTLFKSVYSSKFIYPIPSRLCHPFSLRPLPYQSQDPFGPLGPSPKPWLDHMEV